MEKLARTLAHKFAAELNYDEEKEQVVAYGLIAIIQTMVTVLVSLLLGFAVGAPVEAMILCFSVSLLRRYTGGAHVGYIELCTSIGILYCTLFSYISRYLVGPILTPAWIMGLTAGVYLISYYIIYKLVPVDSPRKPIRTAEKKRRMRKGSFLTLSVYLALSILIIALSFHNAAIKAFQVSLLFGVVWQIFTLTKAGVFVLTRMNIVYEKIFRIRKEV